MATILERVERDLLRRAKEEGAAYAKTQNARLREELDALKRETDAEKKAVTANQRREALAQVDEDVRTASQASMKEALARLQIRERMAHSGHAGGGLQQAALKGAAKTRESDRQKMMNARQDALNTINGNASKLFRELEAAYAKKAESLSRKTAEDIADKQASLDAAAKKQAKQIARSSKSYNQWQAGLY